LQARDRRINDLAFKLQKERDDYVVSLERLDANLKKLEKFYTNLRIVAGFKLEQATPNASAPAGQVSARGFLRLPL